MQKGLVCILCIIGFTLNWISPSYTQETITICGTGDSQELLRLLAIKFEQLNPDVRVVVPDSIGSSGGIKATAKGKCDLGRVARTLKENEVDYGLFVMFFAKSPVVFFANDHLDSIPSLSTNQILDIYSGKTGLWQDIGAATGNIYVANREPGDSSRSVIEKHLPGFKALATFAGKTVYTTPETVETVLNYDGTIGYTSLSALIGRDNCHIFQINGIQPDISSVSDDSYTLVSPLGLVWRQDAAAPALKFIDFLSTERAQKIMISSGTFPVSQKK